MCLAPTRHRFEEPFFVDKWYLDNRFPILFLSIEIELKVDRIEVYYWRIRVVHQILRQNYVKIWIKYSNDHTYMIGARNIIFARQGKYAHKLLVRVERSAKRKIK